MTAMHDWVSHWEVHNWPNVAEGLAGGVLYLAYRGLAGHVLDGRMTRPSPLPSPLGSCSNETRSKKQTNKSFFGEPVNKLVVFAYWILGMSVPMSVIVSFRCLNCFLLC
jgi:hypothetical protein